ncbi:MGMT family protein [Candidatus Gottesmanbacteria bacterium]|nr:MGMT family protein [Candidatus Gottesmanbacteria bacterium]
MTPLAKKVYSLLDTVPRGKVTTYKALAHGAGTKAYRAIGQIMKYNPNAPETPCHRVVATNGTLGGYMGKTDKQTLQKKIDLLKKEGVEVKNNRILNFKNIFYSFS